PVKDPANLTDAEKAKVADEVKKANPTAKDVEVGKDGTATVTFPDGSTAEIPAAKAVEKAKDAEGVKDPEAKTPVKDPANLTDAEKAKVADEVKKANPTAKDVEVGKDGTATVTFPDGSTAEIPAAKAVEKAKDAEGVKDPEAKTPVKDPANLTDAEKAKVADEVKKANPTAKDVEVGKDGTATVTFPDGSTAVIPADKSVKKSDGLVAVSPAANQDSPAQAPAKKAGAKELPNTGTEQSNASLALALLAAATGGLLFAKKREEEE
ncbi:LPXTG cell wall anchor domain-containing protein, partial [Streptococcus infantis]|uniref:LPXTG cell wall anchor domain-containing protein n=2 Tax=Streptococcus infantis TaxID=68892 RepID=UPI0039C261EF